MIYQNSNCSVDAYLEGSHFIDLSPNSFEYTRNCFQNRSYKRKNAIFLLSSFSNEKLIQNFGNSKLYLDDNVYSISNNSIYEIFKVNDEKPLHMSFIGFWTSAGKLIAEETNKWKRRSDLQVKFF